MKKILFCLSFILLLSGVIQPPKAFAQRRLRFENLRQHDDKLYHFGFSLGVNRMNFALRPVEDFHGLESPEPGTHDIVTLHQVLPIGQNGFHLGIVSNLKLGPQLDLRFIPTLAFGDRRIRYSGLDRNGQKLEPPLREQVESTFLEFPLHLKYKSVRIYNSRAYLIGGAKYSYDLASNENKDGEDVLVRIPRHDVYGEIGVGLDHYFEFFKFSLEVKGSLGLTNLIRHDNTIYTNSIDRLNSKMIMISLLFE